MTGRPAGDKVVGEAAGRAPAPPYIQKEKRGNKRGETGMTGKRTAAVAAFMALTAAGPALAHHGWGSYDSSALVTYEGKVLESRYDNPHGMVVIEADGKRWHVVLAPPSRMTNRGLSKDDIAVGKTVKVVGYPSREHDAEMRAERIIVGGRTVELR